ncbi:hypothetical protein GCM10011608_41570 [Micromonospora sonchi]|uniref:Enediyne biosynthesis protein n=1 Tax=Micromonospora sonchi TaxID=1763543 RepID=A0A917U3B5_9ACTN|nr:enediyne biosynthesis protein [Micromonospora sonchi]GGM52381.1 hypothetical protein GCM10011608_41570 [Micromonospora sonchi]
MSQQRTHQKDPRIVTALRRFAISITVLNIFGYTVLGFEQAWAWPLLALAVGYSVEILLETIGAWAEERRARYLGGGARGFIEFLYPAHITSLAVNMLLYVNDQVPVMLLAVMIAISGKWLFRAPVNGRLRHHMNPSNFGIAVALLLFPWISIAPPYQFTEHLTGVGDWIVPAAIVVFGTLLNAKLTGRMWLIAGWLGVFVLQSVFRGLVLDTSIVGALATMTGVAFVLFTNYMITDPGTTPSKPWSQFAFGGSVALVYGVLTGASIVYGLFFATAIVCLIRGGFLWSLHAVRLAARPQPTDVGALDGKVPATVTREMVRA